MRVLSGEIETLSLPDEWAGAEFSLSIGSFDGIHVGHQALIRESVASARRSDRLAGVVTFDPHPAQVLYPERAPRVLTPPQAKLSLLRPLGLDLVVLLSFTARLAATAPQEFVRHLVRGLRMRELWVGPDFALGSDREGDLATLCALGREMKFAVRDIPYVDRGGQRVSSSQVRALLKKGRVAEAATLLGRHYALRGKVIHGAKRGRNLGFPTVNLDVGGECLVPAHGVYAAYVLLDGTRYAAATNIGVRPSFDHGNPSVEAFLLNFDGDLYGREIELAFVKRLRPEERFANVQALIEQMHRDVENTRIALDQIKKPGF
jgi:riboflavin kinase/FMN adenylyltransferase